ncbi:MAG: DNA polymerase III subunit delta' [Anaerolineae bacterium]
MTVIGHTWAIELLLSGLARGRVPHATLIVGPPNIGKTTVAFTFAQALNCTGGRPLPCGECVSCRKIASGNHPDVRILDAPGQTLKIIEVRDLQRELALSPHEGRWRVAVLTEFERATLEAANALLKTLEEPPGQVALVLTATEADVLLPTIVSRCQVLSLRALPRSLVKEALIEQWGAQPAQAELLAHLSNGRLGWAVQALQDEALLARRNEHLDNLASLMGKGRVERLAYAADLSRDPALTREVLAIWLGWWRDILLLVSGSQVAITNTDRMDVLRRQAEQVTVRQAQRMVAQLRSTAVNLDQNVNVRLALEVLLLSLPSSVV